MSASADRPWVATASTARKTGTTSMTRDDVLAITGPIEDRFVVEILDVGGARADLVEAVSRTRGDAAAFSAQHPMSPVVSRLCDIIEAADAAAAEPVEWEDGRL